MKELLQAKVLAAAVKISKNEINKQLVSIQEQLDRVKIIEGPSGPKGDSGEDGKTVIVGNPGDSGPQGEKGDKGEEGNSLIKAGIFEEKLILNFADGEQLDVGKVVGPRGGQGKQGVIGEQGIVGPIGSQGEQGLIGPEGVKGDKGDQGNIGPTGKSGPVGLQGNDGIKGDQGERGDQGPEGEKGPAGQTGLTGSKGDTGEKGDNGPEGPEGADGRLVDLKPLQIELEEGLKSFKDSISSQVTRLALSGGGGSSGGGEVLLHKLDDVDYNTTQSPTDGQSLIWSSAKSKWEANSSSSSLVVKEEGSVVSSLINTLNFVGATVTVSNTSTTDLKINVHPDASYISNTIARGLFSTKAQLANTNTYIATKVNTTTFNSALANTNTYIATKSSLAQLANTNAYIGAVSTREAAHTANTLSHLANTNTYIATKVNTTTFNSALANTNTFTVRKTGAEQTMQPSLVVANTGIFQQGMPVRQAGGNNVTLALSDNGKLIWCVNTASAMNIHIPTNASVAFPIGAEMTFLQKLTHASANTLGFSPASGVTLDSKEAANTVADRHTAATLKKLATNTWILIGNLS